MQKNFILLAALLITAVLLLVSLGPSLAASPRYPALHLSPIPMEGNNTSGESCSGNGEQSVQIPPAQLLDGTGIFLDAQLDSITQAGPDSSQSVSLQTGCTISAASPAS